MDVESLHGRRATHRWERVSVGDLFERVTWSFPDREAIVGWEGAFSHPETERLTYRECDQLLNRFANALCDRGLERGDTVVLFCENSVEAFLTKLAVAKAGLTVVPINPMMAPDVVRYLLGLVEPKLAVVDAELWPRASSAFEQHGLAPAVTIAIGGEPVPGSVDWLAFLDGASDAEPDVAIHGDDVWELLFTSGTTAMPKGAMISHTTTYMSAYAFALSHTRGLRFECDLRLCSFLPAIYHVADQVLAMPAFFCGGTFVIGRRFAPDQIVAAIARERVTSLWGGQPAMLRQVAEVAEGDPAAHDVSSLTTIIWGWAAVSPQLLQRWKRLTGREDLNAFEILGQTECISCTRFWPDMWPETFDARVPNSNYVGVPTPILACDMHDPEGRSLRGTVGVPGETVYRSPSITAGYYRDATATERAFRGGWFHSGDLCEYDEDGLRIMVDRSKDMIKSGGENVSSIRVEAIIAQHEAVAQVAVVGLPHPRWDEAVTAFVVPADGAVPEPGELRAFARERLAGYETPKRFVLVTELPATVGNKVLKYKLRAENAMLYADEA